MRAGPLGCGRARPSRVYRARMRSGWVSNAGCWRRPAGEANRCRPCPSAESTSEPPRALARPTVAPPPEPAPPPPPPPQHTTASCERPMRAPRGRTRRGLSRAGDSWSSLTRGRTLERNAKMWSSAASMTCCSTATRRGGAAVRGICDGAALRPSSRAHVHRSRQRVAKGVREMSSCLSRPDLHVLPCAPLSPPPRPPPSPGRSRTARWARTSETKLRKVFMRSSCWRRNGLSGVMYSSLLPYVTPLHRLVRTLAMYTSDTCFSGGTVCPGGKRQYLTGLVTAVGAGAGRVGRQARGGAVCPDQLRFQPGHGVCAFSPGTA